MSRFPQSAVRKLVTACMAGVLLTGCAYYNTFYNAQAAYREGLKYKEQNQATQAKAKFDKAVEKSALVIKRWPKSAWIDDALFLVGKSYYHQGQYAKAIRHLDQLALAFPQSGFVPEAELYRGLALLEDKQYGTARVALDGVRQKYPRFADDAAFHLARSFLEKQELARAVDSLGVFVQEFPRSPFRREAVVALAGATFKLGQFAESERWYTLYAGLTDNPKERALAKLKIASCRFAQGKYSEAVVQAKDVLGRYSELDDEANLLLGKVMNETGKPQDALDAWAKLRGPGDFGAEAAFRVGKHHEEQGDFVKARAYYDTARVRRVDSDYGVLAVKRLSLLDALAARTSGKKAGGDSLTPAEAAFLVAEVNNLNLGDYDRAMELYQKVYDSFPDTDWAGKALFAKAWILKNPRQDSAAAVPLLQKVIAEYPETEYADESRRWLGLPVPKRKVVKPETTATRPDTLRPPALQPEPPPLPPELAQADTGPAATGEPGMFPPDERGLHGPPGTRLRPRDRGPGATDPVGRPLPPTPVPETTGRGAPADTVKPGRQVPSSIPDTAVTPRPSEKALPASPSSLALEIAHFATDSWQIRSDDSARLEADAESLQVHADVKVTVVGHCDPRASEQYNLELGLRRAQAVRDFLVARGVSAARVETRSDGEKRPISTKPEEYWLDRRVEFEYR